MLFGGLNQKIKVQEEFLGERFWQVLQILNGNHQFWLEKGGNWGRHISS